MSDKLEDTVNQILQSAVEKAAQGTEFLKDQVPDVVQQLIHWKIASYSMTILIAVVVVTISYKATFKWSDQELKESYFHTKEWSFTKCMAAGIGIAASAVAIVAAMTRLFYLIEILVAPKVWLLEYAASLMRR